MSTVVPGETVCADDLCTSQEACRAVPLQSAASVRCDVAPISFVESVTAVVGGSYVA